MDLDLQRMATEPERSTVCMHFTTWQALQLVVQFDPAILRACKHGGIVDDHLLARVLRWTIDLVLWPYRPSLLLTEI